MIRLWMFYPLTAAMAHLLKDGWYMRAHVLVIGPLWFSVGWREKVRHAKP